MTKAIENMRIPGCGTIIFALGMAAMDKQHFYEKVLQKRGEAGLDQLLTFFEDQFKSLPSEIINNPEKVMAMRQAVAEEFDGRDEQIIKNAAEKVVTAFENRLVAKSLLTRENSLDSTAAQAKVDFGVSMGEAMKASMDLGRLVAYTLPVVRNWRFRSEIKKYGEPQGAVTPGLFEEVCNLVKN